MLTRAATAWPPACNSRSLWRSPNDTINNVQSDGTYDAVCSSCVLLAGSVGCPVPQDDDGEGEGEDEGATRPVLADTCADTPCDDGSLCLAIGGDDGEDPACFLRCDIAGDTCVTASNRAGTCTARDDGTAVCIATVANLDGCGNQANAVCGADSLCAVFPNLGNVRSCVRPCDPSNPSTCRSGVEPCGCDEGEVCTSFVVSQSGDNICAPPAGSGATCGFESNGDIHPCDAGRRCVVQGAPFPGRCE